jgi:ribose-phosphate pyrophosphokinase
VTTEIYLDGKRQDFTSLIFSVGEVQVRLGAPSAPNPARIRLVAHIRSSDALMELFCATDALRRRHGDVPIDLVMPYLPYARQDRVCAPGEAISLRMMSVLINAQRYDRVEVWDVHSEAALDYLDRSVSKPASDFAMIVAEHLSAATVIVAPDKGALARAYDFAGFLGLDTVHAEKIRNPDDGAILGTAIHCGDIGDRDFLMVDDICDGGRTFIELAKELRKLTTGRVMLYVTHGIFSKGFGVFDGLVDRIFVANSFWDTVPDFVTKL